MVLKIPAVLRAEPSMEKGTPMLKLLPARVYK